MRCQQLTIAAVSLLAVPAYAGTVYYNISLAGPGRNIVVMKVDTGEMQKGGIIRPAPFTVIIRRNNGTLVPQYYRFPSLESGKVYETRIFHGIVGARSVSAADISWGMDAAGGKADGSPIVIGSSTDMLGAVAAGTPSAIQTHCQAYSKIATQQFYEAQNRQCGFSGSRWSPNYQYHYQWCVGVLVPESNGETQARATAISQCAHR